MEDNSNLFTVSPMAKNLNLEPGEVYEDTILVTNPATSSTTFSYRVEPVAYAVEDDIASFTTETDMTLIKDWIKIDEEDATGTLKPNESKTVHFKITVPKSAPGGGQYAALMVSSSEKAVSSDDVSVNNVYEIASLIYAKVKGEVLRGGEIVDNKVPGFVTGFPIELKATVSNDGNIHESAKVSVEVRDHFSGEVLYPQVADDGVTEEPVMPGANHDIVRNIDGLAPLGVYDVVQTVDYLGKTSENSQTVIACPIWFMVLVAVTIVAIIGGVFGIIRHRRKKKSEIF